VTSVQQAPAPAREEGSSTELAERYGLTRAGARPPLWSYAAALWRRRHFIISYTRASNAVAYNNSFLGQVWQVLTPLLNAGVYYLVFGLLLHTSSHVHNYKAYLIIGIFVFTFMQNAIINGSRSVTNNLNIIRALHFPRASLPLGTTAIAFQQLLVSISVMVPIVLLTGEPIRLTWLLVIPVLLLESLFSLGAALVVARVGARVPDTAQFLPFVLRTWLYVSGIFYQIAAFTKGHSHWVRQVLELNPGAAYPQLVREALLTKQPVSHYAWTVAFGWAFAVFAFGLVFFWWGEESYGRG
jgi:teichoic acid transport system permease protein